MDIPSERDFVLDHLARRIHREAIHTLKYDTTSPFAGLLLRQRMIDAVRDTDNKFGSEILYQYYPAPYYTDDGGIMISFTDMDDSFARYVQLVDLEPFPDRITEEEDEPIETLMPAPVYARRHDGIRKGRKR